MRLFFWLFSVFMWLAIADRLSAEDWPHWRGIGRNDVSSESSGYRDGEWITEVPAWSAECGIGASSPIVADGRVYSMGWSEGQDRVTCIAAGDGKTIWSQTYASPRYGRYALGDQGFYSGPCSTPAFDEQSKRLFTLGTDGDLNCWDASHDGRPIWHVNLYDAYHAQRRPRVGRSGHRDYGYTSSPLLMGNTLIVEAGAPAGNLVALDSQTGQLLWSSEAKDAAGHNSGPSPITVEGVPCVAVLTFEGLLVARIDAGHEGETVAASPWKTDFGNNVASVVVHDSDVLITSAYNHHQIVRLHVTLQGAQKVWEQDVASKVCTPIVHDGNVYWAWQQLHCLDYATGQEKWSGGRFGDAGSCIVTADDRLVVWSGQGDLTLCETVKRSPAAFTPLVRRTGLATNEAWPHVVLADGRLYCKDRSGRLICFALPAETGDGASDNER
jgi:outer membrane protein assembly factor BamB